MILYYIIVPLAWLVFNIGFRVRCEGRENLKKVGTKGCIIAPNHISAIDPVFIVITRFWGQRMMVFAKKELFEINPFLSWFFRCAGAVCVRGTKEEVGAIDDTVKKCKEGGTLLIFPEGTREKENAFLPLKSGLFVVAAAAGVDVGWSTASRCPPPSFQWRAAATSESCGRISRLSWRRGRSCKGGLPSPSRLRRATSPKGRAVEQSETERARTLR